LVAGAGAGDFVASVADPLPVAVGSASGLAAAAVEAPVLRARGRERDAAVSDARPVGSLGPFASGSAGAFAGCSDGAAAAAPLAVAFGAVERRDRRGADAGGFGFDSAAADAAVLVGVFAGASGWAVVLDAAVPAPAGVRVGVLRDRLADASGEVVGALGAASRYPRSAFSTSPVVTSRLNVVEMVGRPRPVLSAI
jgi:hypothetical protein